MKPLLTALTALFIVTAPLRAQIYADVATTEGTFTIDLDYANSPLAVGNFIGLATGSKKWIDSTTGAVMSDTPYYDGIIFHRVIAGFMNQTGSQKGDGSDGPGYRFTDEFTTSDFSDPYLVANANSGPQTNGSQFFVTVPPPPLQDPPIHLNNVHTVFGTVPVDDGPDGIVDGSRDVIDAINAVAVTGIKPTTDVVINSITIRRIGAAAEAFDAAAQNLPSVAELALAITPSPPDPDPLLSFVQDPGTTFNCGHSADLETWRVSSRYYDSGSTGPLNTFDTALIHPGDPRRFYNPALVTWPSDAVFPHSLANRTLTVIAPPYSSTAPFVFTFDSTGTSGTRVFNPAGTPELGTVQVERYRPDGYGATVILLLDEIDYPYWVLRRVGMDSTTPTQLAGRHVLTLAFSELHYQLNIGTLNTGHTFTITR